MERLRSNIDIILIIVVGFALRFSISYTHSYSNDELSAVTRLRFDNFSELIEYGVMKGDMHPAGVQVFMKGWSMIAGTSEIGMRLPFVLFGTFSIFLIFYLGKRWFSRQTGLFAAGLLAFLYFPILNSELARPYSVGLMLALLVMVFFDKVLLRHDKKWSSAILLGIFMALAMYTHYFAFLFIGFIGFTGLFLLNRENARYYWVAALVTVVLFAPHIPVTLFHLGVGGLQWLGPPDWDWLLHFLFFVFNDSVVLLITVLVVLSVAIFWAYKKGIVLNDKGNGLYKQLCLLWFFGIFIIGFILSYVSTPVLKYPVMLFPLPAFLLYLSGWLAQVPLRQYVLWGLLGVAFSSSVWEKELYENTHFALFKEPGIMMADWNETYGDEDIYTIYHTNNPDYINFYQEEWGGEPLTIDWDQIPFDGDYALFDTLMTRDERYCVMGFSSCLTLVQAFETVRVFYPVVVDYKQFNNGAVFLLRKEEGSRLDQVIPIEPIAHFASPGPYGKWDFDESQVAFTDKTGSHYVLTPESPYGPNFRFKRKDLPNEEEGYLKVSVSSQLQDASQLTVAFSATREGEPLLHRGEPVWQGRDLERSILPNPTDKGIFAFQIPDYIHPSDDLLINLWNRGSDTIVVNHFSIEWVANYWNE